MVKIMKHSFTLASKNLLKDQQCVFEHLNQATFLCCCPDCPTHLISSNEKRNTNYHLPSREKKMDPYHSWT